MRTVLHDLYQNHVRPELHREVRLLLKMLCFERVRQSRLRCYVAVGLLLGSAYVYFAVVVNKITFHFLKKKLINYAVKMG